jgi:hypothetical protein
MSSAAGTDLLKKRGGHGKCLFQGAPPAARRSHSSPALPPQYRENFSIFQGKILGIEKNSFLSPWNLRSFLTEIDLSISHIWAVLIDEVLEGYICFWIFASKQFKL